MQSSSRFSVRVICSGAVHILGMAWRITTRGFQILAGQGLDVSQLSKIWASKLSTDILCVVCRWTNGRFKSTLHRVVVDGSADRYSIPFFFEPNFDTVVECLPSCCGQDNPPRCAKPLMQHVFAPRIIALTIQCSWGKT